MTQYIGFDLHRRRTVLVRMSSDGEVLETRRVNNEDVPAIAAVVLVALHSMH